MLRRRLALFGNAELGGVSNMKYVTGAFFISLWFFYIIISSLVSYDVIEAKIWTKATHGDIFNGKNSLFYKYAKNDL